MIINIYIVVRIDYYNDIVHCDYHVKISHDND